MNRKRKLKEYMSRLDSRQFKLFYSIFVHYWVKHKVFISSQNFLNLWCELNLICSQVDESFPDPYYDYPELSGKLRLLDIWTPATYKRYVGSEIGSFMSFALPKKRGLSKISGKEKSDELL